MNFSEMIYNLQVKLKQLEINKFIVNIQNEFLQ